MERKVSMRQRLLLVHTAVVLLVLVPSSCRAMSCGDIVLNLSDCVWYLTGTHARPSAACCDGMRHLHALATTAGDRRLACRCMKELAPRYDGFKYELVNCLPRQCSATLSYKIDFDNCDGAP